MAANGPEELFLIDGNSLVYRAFFALPESIATSTGIPTNAIFGFASMLVKILTEHGTKPTVVVWDAGSSGRKEIYPEYKATRTVAPRPAARAVAALRAARRGVRLPNIRLDGFEADDVIATIAEQARARRACPVMIVTGDRDAFQLIDPEARVQVMATSRGITDTKLYDHQAVIDRYGIAPELIPDFYGLKGDTCDNIPGVPGIGDKTAADLLQRFGDLEGVLASVDEISGAKRKENLTNHAEDARISKVLATIRATSRSTSTRRRGRPARPTARSCARSSASSSCATRCGAWRSPSATEERAAPAPVDERLGRGARARGHAGRRCARSAGGPEVMLAVRARGPRGRAVRRRPDVALRRRARARTCSPARCDDPEDLVRALGDRAVVAHDAKALGVVPPNLAHDALLGAYLLEPARRGFPLRELCEERGLAPTCADDGRRRGRAVCGAGRAGSASRSSSAGCRC